MRDLFLGDCLPVLDRLEESSVDMVLTDLPYGETNHGWDDPIDLEELWKRYKRVCKPNAALVFFASMKFSAKLISSNPKWFHYDLVWEKNKSTGFLNSKRQPLRSHEHLLVFYDKMPVYNPQKTTGHKPMNAGVRKHHGKGYGAFTRTTNIDKGTTERYPKSIIKIPVVNNDSPTRLHSSQKPVALLRWLIRSYTNPGDVVLDNCMGSGSTIVAAIQENRSFVGVEVNPSTYSDAEKWIADNL